MNDLTVHCVFEGAKIHQEGLLEGIKMCRDSLFEAEPGQKLLHFLCTSMRETYLQHSSFLGDMAPHIRFYYEYVFDAAVQQHSDPSFSGTFDRGCPLKNLPLPPGFTWDPTRTIEET